MTISRVGIYGSGEWILRSPTGAEKRGYFENTITDVGDQFYAQKSIGLTPAVPTCMILGIGTTATAKNGTGSYLSNKIGAPAAFDSTYPSAATKGAGLGWRIQYRSSWPSGTGLMQAIAEIVLDTETTVSTATGNSSANVLARSLFTPTFDKEDQDTLQIIWNHDLLGQ